MPGQKIPADMVSFTDTFAYEENYKTESLSSRSSSPKSLPDTEYSLSESSESPEGSIIFDFDGDVEKISNELDNMKITEIQAKCKVLEERAAAAANRVKNLKKTIF